MIEIHRFSEDESSVIAEVSYNGERRPEGYGDVHIHIRTKGGLLSLYKYEDVSLYEFRSLVHAESVGSYFSSYFRTGRESVRVA